MLRFWENPWWRGRIFVDTVREEGRHLGIGGDLIVGFVDGDNIVGIVGDQGDAPHVCAHIAPPPDNSFTIEDDFTTTYMKNTLQLASQRIATERRLFVMVGALCASRAAGSS